MRIPTNFQVGTLAVTVLGALSFACDAPGATIEPDAMPITGTCTYFVQNHITLLDKRRSLAVKVDDGELRNEVGFWLAVFSQAHDWERDLNQAIADGRTVVLSQVQADDLDEDASAGWTFYAGAGTSTPPAFDGSDVFSVASDAEPGATLRGSIVTRQFTGYSPGMITLSVPWSDPPLQLTVMSLAVEDAVISPGDPTRIASGRWGGALRQEDFYEQLLPALLPPTNELFALVCTSTQGRCSCEGQSVVLRALAQYADHNGDCVLTVDEVVNNTSDFAPALPDVDARDENGDPGQDGINDSFSLGMGFTAVEAQFDAPCP